MMAVKLRPKRLLVVTGSRDWPDEQRAKIILRHYIREADVVMHGGAMGYGHHPSGDKKIPWGADYWADEVAKEYGKQIEVEPYISKLGKSGGVARNKIMIDRAKKAKELGWQVKVLGLHHNQSKGTADCLTRAVLADLDTVSYTLDQPIPMVHNPNVESQLWE